VSLGFGLALVVLGVVGAAMVTALQSLLADEARAWLPHLSKWLVRSAARRLPPSERADYERDWLAEIAGWSDRPLSMTIKATHLRWGANDIRGSLSGCSVRGDRLKRTMDIAVAGVALMAFVPLLALIALAIRGESEGPVFFRAVRVGRDGKQFSLLKFRTFDLNSGHDPRLTRVGRLLRRTYLDELPQLANVLRGDMSLVGPRPFLLRVYESSSDEAMQVRSAVRPGLTGPTQLALDDAQSFDEVLRRDTDYARSRSIWTDLAILGRTFTAAFGHPRQSGRSDSDD
jgi:lipopolysaccharide/colanic/teichoic acid biosynthesis glycosyltransferase